MLPELIQDTRVEAEMMETPTFGIVGHAYQPPRLFNVEFPLDNKVYHAGFTVAPEYNEIITNQVYKPILCEVEHLPEGFITSIYAPLRSYLKRNEPEAFKNMQEAVRNTPDKKYGILGDPLVHVILPLLKSEDQLMLLKAGKQAFKNDFGFEPKGVWLPETAVTKEVLHNAVLAGYEFVPLRDSQVTNIPEGIRLDAKHNVCMVRTGENEEIAVLLGNSELSGFISFTPWSTDNADGFMEGRQRDVNNTGENIEIMSDDELYGHHRKDVDKFLKRTLEIQKNYGFSPLSMHSILESFRKTRTKTYVDVKEKSSWSCDHELGRWTGNCGCDYPSDSALHDKQEFYENLMDMNEFVNSSLDTEFPGWRDEFTQILVKHSDDMFTGVNFAPELFDSVIRSGGSFEKAKKYLAKMEIMTGLTSCGWFFGGEGRPERDIPSSMIQGVKDLFPEYYKTPDPQFRRDMSYSVYEDARVF
jgi:hypothetical protein